MDIASALETLRNAPTQVLQSYKHETIEALQEIEARLRLLDSPGSDPSIQAFTAVVSGSNSHRGLSEVVPAQLPSSAEQLTSSDTTRLKPSCSANLLTALLKFSPWVWKSTKSPPSKVLGIKRPRVCDRRLEDIRRIEGDPKAGPRYKIIRVLAQRSLVLEGEKSGNLDVERYCEIASLREPGKANKGRQGKIASYVREELDVEEEDKGFAIRAISAGIKQLVTERLLKKRLEEAGQCVSASGISAFTALVVRPFRCLKYEEIPGFLDQLLENDSMNFPASMEDNSEMDSSEAENILAVSTTRVIQVTSAWFDGLQTYYNKFLSVHEDVDQRQRKKRKHACPSHIFFTANSSTEPPLPLDRPSAIESASAKTSTNGSTRDRLTGQQESLVTYIEDPDYPQSNISGSPCNDGPESPLLVIHERDDQNQSRLIDPPIEQQRHLMSDMEDGHHRAHDNTLFQAIVDLPCTTNLVQSSRSSVSSLYARESRSNFENATSDTSLSDSHRNTSQLHGPSIQSNVDANDTRFPFDPWQNVHATVQLNDPTLTPYANTDNARAPFDPWQNVHATVQLNDPTLTPYANTDNARAPFDPWQNVHATAQPSNSLLEPRPSTNATQVTSSSSRHVPCQVNQHPVRVTLPLYRTMTAQSGHTATQFSNSVGMALQATW